MEVPLWNREVGTATLVANMMQLEQQHSETQKLLAQERSVRALQDEQLHRQQEVMEENRDQILRLRAELEHLQANSRFKESGLLEENETLKEQLQDATTEAKANSDALAHSAFNWRQQMAALKSELSVKLSQAQSDALELRRQLEEANDKCQTKEKALPKLKKSTVEADLKMQYETLKRKALKMREQKNDAESRLYQVEARLNQEINTSSELQKELGRVRTMEKTAEKRLHDQDTRVYCNMSQNIQELVDRETLRRQKLEKDNAELQKELSSLKRSEQRHLDELQELRRQMDFAQREHSLTKERTRHELQHKLDQVNLFLRDQAASQMAQDQINAEKAAYQQSQLEQKIQELESEVSHGRSTVQDSLSQQDAIRTELYRYKSMYSEENRLRKALEAKPEHANTRQYLSSRDSGVNYCTKWKSDMDSYSAVRLTSAPLCAAAAMGPESVAWQQYKDQLWRKYQI